MQKLLIFTRYPLPGQSKTRLIPALGAAAAARLQRRMTEQTLTVAQTCGVDIEVWFTGGTELQLQAWLGTEPSYRPQPSGDLGQRMQSAFEHTFLHGTSQVVIIGTDCPHLSADLLQRAFTQLQSHDLVLGEAADGGYYLIGLRHPIPQLFEQIPWSTHRVLTATLDMAHSLNLAVHLLPCLSDIDRPEDLAHLPAHLQPD
jgi:rSAM/selenodomain-associated transferase 1